MFPEFKNVPILATPQVQGPAKPPPEPEAPKAAPANLDTNYLSFMEDMEALGAFQY
jgi:hypothetical protein